MSDCIPREPLSLPWEAAPEQSLELDDEGWVMERGQGRWATDAALSSRQHTWETTISSTQQPSLAHGSRT